MGIPGTIWLVQRAKGMENQLSKDFIYDNDYLHLTKFFLMAIFLKNHKELRVVF